MSAFPKEISQAASKSAVRKKKREQKSLLIAPVNEGVNDPGRESKGEGGHTVWPAPDTLSRPPNQCFAFEASEDGRKGVGKFYHLPCTREQLSQ